MNNPEIDLISYKDNSIYDSNDKYKEMYNCGKIFLYNEYNYVFDVETKKCIGQREYDQHVQKYFVKNFNIQ